MIKILETLLSVLQSDQGQKLSSMRMILLLVVLAVLGPNVYLNITSTNGIAYSLTCNEVGLVAAAILGLCFHKYCEARYPASPQTEGQAKSPVLSE